MLGPVESRGIHQVIVAQPLEPPERPVCHLELHRVVEPAPTADQLESGVAKDVVCKAQARGAILSGKFHLKTAPENSGRSLKDGISSLFQAQPEIEGQSALASVHASWTKRACRFVLGIRHNPERRPHLVVAARDRTATRRPGPVQALVLNGSVDHRCTAGRSCTENVVELVRLIDIVSQSVVLPAEAQAVLAGRLCWSQVAPAHRNGALLLEVLRTCSSSRHVPIA